MVSSIPDETYLPVVITDTFELTEKQAAELSYKLATGDSLSVDTTISDGSFDVPYVTIDPVAVNKDNIEVPWMVYYLEEIKASGYNKYIVLKMTHSLSWTARDGST